MEPRGAISPFLPPPIPRWVPIFHPLQASTLLSLSLSLSLSFSLSLSLSLSLPLLLDNCVYRLPPSASPASSKPNPFVIGGGELCRFPLFFPEERPPLPAPNNHPQFSYQIWVERFRRLLSGKRREAISHKIRESSKEGGGRRKKERCTSSVLHKTLPQATHATKKGRSFRLLSIPPSVLRATPTPILYFFHPSTF